MKSKRYPELHNLDWSPNWVFRKYSSAKRGEFTKSTGIPATEANAARAYAIGLEAFNTWLGGHLPSGRRILIRDLARAILSLKEGKRANTYRSARHQLENHVVPAFGHLHPSQITPSVWQEYDQAERKKGARTKLYNTRKALLECLHRAHSEGMIRTVPELGSFDAPAAPPRYLTAKDFARLQGELSGNVKLLAFIMYHQGPRPSEACQYRFSMIDWRENTIAIPGEITKTGRARTIPMNSKVALALASLMRKRRTPEYVDGGPIFPSAHNPSEPMRHYNAQWNRAMANLGETWTIYNLRDTFITNRLKAGLASTFIGKYCDTSAEMIEKKYAVAEASVMRKVAG